MAEALKTNDNTTFQVSAATALAAGQVVQLPDGRAGVVLSDAAAGATINVPVVGQYAVGKATNVNILSGGRVYWDYSANLATFEKVNDRDFYMGRAVGDASDTAPLVAVSLNTDPPYDVDALRDGCLVVPVGTQAVGGFGFPKIVGGSQSVELSATNEAQKIDLLSVDGFATGAKAIVEAIFRVTNDGAGTTPDFNIGVANGTNATDADAITEHAFIHTDGNAALLKAQSKDSGTTVAATDTTKTYTEGSAVANRVEVWIDTRDLTNVKFYIEGVRVLSGTTFKLNAATGPLFLLAHLEKTISTDVYVAVVDALRARFMEQ